MTDAITFETVPGAVQALLILGATLRLTRLVTTDELGLRVRGPIEDWLTALLHPSRYWLIDGLSCPFCIGFWIGLTLVWVTPVLESLAPDAVFAAWMLLLLALTLNYVVGHVSSRLDRLPDYDELTETATTRQEGDDDDR